MTAGRAATLRDNEELKVHVWRCNQLIGLGFKLAEAEELIEAGVDYHDVCDLVEAGCPLELAKDVLR